ncbi:helix-turn-helix transcriptional regulator [Nocardioides montaniterrae]
MATRSSPVMVGRDAELSEMSGLLGVTDAPGPGFGAVLLAGDAGVGKTRLLMALRDRAVDAGWRVVAGACLDFGDSALPYLPFSIVLGRLSAELPDAVAEVAVEHPALDGLQPGRRMGQGDSESPATDRAALFTAVHALVERAAAASPLLLVVEDVHWADRSTRDLLGYLFSRSYAGRVAIVASYRTNDLHRRHPLRRHLAEWTRLPDMQRIALDPLPDPAVEELIDRLAPSPLAPELRAQILSRAEGNAFFVEELVASDCGGQCMPDDLADVLLVSLDQLSDDARTIVRLASVAGRRVGHELLSAASDLSADAFEAGVRQAVETNLLVAGASAYSFRHALLGEAVYDDLLPGERVRLHQQYVAALTAGSVAGTAAELARHAWQARDLDRAVTAGVAAGDEALAVGGPDEAVQHYENVLELLDAERAARLGIDVSKIVVKTAEALAASGDAKRAVALLAANRDCWPADDVLARARILDAYADLLGYVESDLDPVGVAAEAVALAPTGSRVRAKALATQARLLAKMAMLGSARAAAEAEALATEGLELAERLGLGAVVADLVATLGGLRGGDLHAALLGALEQAEASGAVRPAMRARWLLARSHQDRGEWDEAARWFASILDGNEAKSWALYVLDARWQLGLLGWLRGRWDDALEALAVGSGPGVPVVPRAVLAPTRLSIQHARGADVLEELVALREVWPDEGAVAVYSAGAELEAYADTGDAAAAVAVYDHVTGLLAEIWQPRFHAWLRLAAQALAAIAAAVPTASAAERAGWAAQAERIAEEGRLVAKSHQWQVEGLMWQARLEAEHLRVRWLCGEAPPTRADLVAAWDLALAATDRMDHVVEGARVRATYASVLRQLGDRDRARALADEARAVAHELGWVRLQGALTAAGAAPHSAERAGVRLTERELEILGHVAEGRSNGEIGKLLFISTKTVSVHVSNILGKMGAASRTEAAAIARRDGLL